MSLVTNSRDVSPVTFCRSGFALMVSEPPTPVSCEKLVYFSPARLSRVIPPLRDFSWPLVRRVSTGKVLLVKLRLVIEFGREKSAVSKTEFESLKSPPTVRSCGIANPPRFSRDSDPADCRLGRDAFKGADEPCTVTAPVTVSTPSSEKLFRLVFPVTVTDEMLFDVWFTTCMSLDFWNVKPSSPVSAMVREAPASRKPSFFLRVSDLK